MGRRDRDHDRQAQATAATALAATRRIRAPQPPAELIELVVGHARAVIVDGDPPAAEVRPRGHRDPRGAPGPGVDHGVADQVGDRLLDARWIDDDRRSLGIAGDRVAAGSVLRAADHAAGVRREVAGCALEPELGLVELRMGRHAEAAENLKRVVAAEPDNARAQGYLGLALMRAGALQERCFAPRW